jgi:hypothetical protein
MKMPTPIVTMISESSDRWNSGRRTTRLKRSASPIMATQATPSAPPSPAPSMWLAAAAIREPTIVHSPTAKLIMREAL